jgi:glucokinase
MKRYTIGIDVGGTKVAYGLFDGEKNIVKRLSHPADKELAPEPFFDIIAENILMLMREHGVTGESLRGVGMGMPSFILFEDGFIVKTSNLTNIRGFPARTWLMKKLGGIRVIIDNDSHTGAIAEYRLGAGRGFDNMLYNPVSTGISTGIIINGKIFRGRYGWSGETGHMIVTPGEGIECGCGNRGCIMSWSSGSMIIKHIQSWIASGEKTVMTEMAGGPGGITAFELEKAFLADDPLAVRAIEQMTKFLGIWTYNLYVTLNINCFVFGGGLVKMGRAFAEKGGTLLDRMKAVFDTYNGNDMPVYFKETELGDDSGIIGASELLF